MGEFTSRARAALKAVTDPREKLRRFAELHFSLLEEERDIAIVLQVELRQSTKFMEQFSTTHLATYLQMIREIVEEGQKTGLFRRQLNATIVAKFLFGALDEMATNWILSKRRYKLVPMADQVMDIFLNGVSAA